MPNPEGGLWLQTLRFVVRHITWKLIAQLAVTAMLSGCMYFVWEARGKLSTMALSHWAHPEMDVQKLPALVEGLESELKPDSIFVWSANVSADTRRPLLVWIKGVRRPELEDRVEPLFPDHPEKMLSIVKLIRGEEYCMDHTPWSPVGRILSDAGIKWVCSAGIPPQSTALVGVVTVGFSEKRSDDQTRIVASLRRWSDYVTDRGL